MVDPSIASAHTGHGIVMPQCHHGGPGRAGNGAELGGLYGLRFYHQRVAVQGSTTAGEPAVPGRVCMTRSGRCATSVYAVLHLS
jgi:3,4-dehydroadipyl-CoA semialdehyde dehydrogenase